MKAWEGIAEYFGREFLNEDLTINRLKLGEVIFNDAEKRERLNQIVHPEIFKEDERIANQIRELDPNAFIVKDIPLLTEALRGWLVDKIVVVSASEETQRKRLLQRGLSEEGARNRIEAQPPIEEKVRFADVVIHNDGSFEETKEQVERIYTSLKG